MPDATDMFSANTLFFRQSSGTKQLTLPSRAHAELIHHLAIEGLHGDLHLPASELDAASLLTRLRDRLVTLTEKARQLAGSRTSDDARAIDLAGLLRQWMLHEKPQPNPRKTKTYQYR